MRILKWLAGAVAAIALVLVATLVVAGALYGSRAPMKTASGLPHSQSLYLTMSDGVHIALDVVLPMDLAAGAKVPVLIKGTPYWRGAQLSFLGGAFAQLGLLPDMSEPDVAQLNAHGYAVLLVDTRGTGASGGHVGILLDEREVADFGEVIDWAAAQPWSNGRVGAYGFSYRGLLATGMAALNKPALKAFAPTFDFSDLYLTMRPGGVLSENFVQSWSTFTEALNHGEAPWCDRLLCRLMLAGPERVESDRDGTLYAAALAEHAKNWNVFDCARNAFSRDDKVCDSGRSFTDVSELADRAAIEQSGIPIYSTVGYFDANSAALALARRQALSNSQILEIGALSHGGFMSTDPFKHGGAADPSPAEQVTVLSSFFDPYLKDGMKPAAPKAIRYLVLNGGGWKTTDRWPPAGAHAVPWYFGADHVLVAARPSAAGVDEYSVDFSASTGTASRYRSPVDLSPTAYPDRAAQDKKLLVYNSEPLAADIEIAGSPLATLTLGANVSDAAVIVYLERVAADGAVTYLSEGVLRLAHRKLADHRTAIVSADAHHSYLAADASPWPVNQVEPIVIELNPIAVRLNTGDRLRVAIGGADADNLERVPANGAVKFGIIRGALEASRIEIPQVQP